MDVLTQHYGKQRNGTNLEEKRLTPQALAGGKFHKLLDLGVDGHVYAQPLYVSQFPVGNEHVGVVFIATMTNKVYAFNATTGHLVWTEPTSLGKPVDAEDHVVTPDGYHDIQGTIGILSTPVISDDKKWIYVLAATGPDPVTGRYRHTLHKLDLLTGAKKAERPVEGSVPGVGYEDEGDKSIEFDSRRQNQRPALLLANNRIYAAFASYGDRDPYHGWVFGFDLDLKDRPIVFNTTRYSKQGGIWMAGFGPAADDAGNVYVVTGNGTFWCPRRDTDYEPQLGDSFIKLTKDLTLSSWFTPWNTHALNTIDADVGSSGVLVMKDDRSREFIVGGGKEGRMYVLDPENMGGWCEDCCVGQQDSQIVQSFQATAIGTTPEGVGGRDAPPPPVPRMFDYHHIHGSAVFWRTTNGARLYVWGECDWLRSFELEKADNGNPRFKRSQRSTFTTPAESMPGGMLTLSADGPTLDTGVIWATHPIKDRDDANLKAVPGKLRAIRASDLTLLWESDANEPHDPLGSAAKFTPPTVADGKVFVATFSNRVRVYGVTE